MVSENDDTGEQGAEEAAAERRRLIDLTRRDKGLPERRNLRRIRVMPLWLRPKEAAAEDDGRDLHPPAD